MASQAMPCLWFNNTAKEAVDYYLSIFQNGRILSIDYYTEVGEEFTGHKKGDVVTIEFEILGTRFIALNAGPEFTFNPSISFLIECDDQEEIDCYWESLSADPAAEQCGWLVDKFGLSWQVVPKMLNDMLKNGSPEQRKRVTEAYINMKKFEISKLIEAYRIP